MVLSETRQTLKGSGEQMSIVHIKDIDNLDFWINYFGCSYPNAYDEENDVSVSDIMLELYTEEIKSYWEKFTGYYPGVFDKCDGYVDNPTTLETSFAKDKTLKIEFHPGDTIYFINGEEIGCTGPHWKLQVIAFDEIEQVISLENGRQLFLLLLPLAFLAIGDTQAAHKKIMEQIQYYFPEHLSISISNCIVAGLSELCN